MSYLWRLCSFVFFSIVACQSVCPHERERRDHCIASENHTSSCVVAAYETYGRILETRGSTSSATEGAVWRLQSRLHEYYKACFLSDQADRECVEALASMLRAERAQRRQLQENRINTIRSRLGGGSTTPPPTPRESDSDAGPAPMRPKQAEDIKVIDLVGADSEDTKAPKPVEIILDEDADNDGAEGTAKTETLEE